MFSKLLLSKHDKSTPAQHTLDLRRELGVVRAPSIQHEP